MQDQIFERRQLRAQENTIHRELLSRLTIAQAKGGIAPASNKLIISPINTIYEGLKTENSPDGKMFRTVRAF